MYSIWNWRFVFIVKIWITKWRPGEFPGVQGSHKISVLSKGLVLFYHPINFTDFPKVIRLLALWVVRLKTKLVHGIINKSSVFKAHTPKGPLACFTKTGVFLLNHRSFHWKKTERYWEINWKSNRKNYLWLCRLEKNSSILKESESNKDKTELEMVKRKSTRKTQAIQNFHENSHFSSKRNFFRQKNPDIIIKNHQNSQIYRRCRWDKCLFH